MNIYLICTGNTCRSPMAEAILRARNIDKVTVRSAGIHASNGAPIAPNARVLIEKEGMPYTPISREVTTEDVEWADVILTMTETHKYALLHSFPDVSDKTFTLKEYVNPEAVGDVHDPFGGNLATYKRTFDELSAIMDVFEQKLIGG